jgi:cyclopropane-fatty-acyl-phospholipid synthase
MSYSAASFIDRQESLESAQNRKYGQLLDRLEASPEHELLEIGCGWGGLAEVAAKRGHKIDGVTLSREQLHYARGRLNGLGLSERARFSYCDYRDISKQYDHIVSIEMFEAVGERYWPALFKTMNTALRPGGRAALQVITIDESHFESYRNDADFIQLYIFPGGMLPSLTRFREHAMRSGFRVVDSSVHAADYIRTLQIWAKRFESVHEEIRALGFDERFIRMWRYYLAYCEAGFKAGRVDLARVTLEKVS